MAVFYDNLHKRQEQIDKYKLREGIKVTMEVDPASTVLTFKNVSQYFIPKTLIPVAPTVTVAPEPTHVIPVTSSSTAGGISAPPSAPNSRFNSRRNTSNNLTYEAYQSSDDDSDAETTLTTRPNTGNSLKSPTPHGFRTPAKTAGVGIDVRVLDSWEEVEALGGPAQHLMDGRCYIVLHGACCACMCGTVKLVFSDAELLRVVKRTSLVEWRRGLSNTVSLCTALLWVWLLMCCLANMCVHRPALGTKLAAWYDPTRRRARRQHRLRRREPAAGRHPARRVHAPLRLCHGKLQHPGGSEGRAHGGATGECIRIPLHLRPALGTAVYDL
jgi:hypothetical protein